MTFTQSEYLGKDKLVGHDLYFHLTSRTLLIFKYDQVRLSAEHSVFPHMGILEK